MAPNQRLVQEKSTEIKSNYLKCDPMIYKILFILQNIIKATNSINGISQKFMEKVQQELPVSWHEKAHRLFLQIKQIWLYGHTTTKTMKRKHLKNNGFIAKSLRNKDGSGSAEIKEELPVEQAIKDIIMEQFVSNKGNIAANQNKTCIKDTIFDECDALDIPYLCNETNENATLPINDAALEMPCLFSMSYENQPLHIKYDAFEMPCQFSRIVESDTLPIKDDNLEMQPLFNELNGSETLVIKHEVMDMSSISELYGRETTVNENNALETKYVFEKSDTNETFIKDNDFETQSLIFKSAASKRFDIDFNVLSLRKKLTECDIKNFPQQSLKQDKDGDT